MSDRLDFADVERLVGELADDHLEQLVVGPMPDGDDPGSPWNCRVCFTLSGPLVSPGSSIFNRAAFDLVAWHEAAEDFAALDDVVGGWRRFSTEEDRHRVRAAVDEWEAVAGSLQYARCCTIYALARIELAARRL